MIKVLHTISEMGINSGGTTTCTYVLLKGLISQGVDANVLTYSPNENDKLISDEPFIHLVKRPKETRFGYSNKFRNALEKQLDTEIIHANGLWLYSSYIAWKIAVKNNIPFAISPHGMLYPIALNKSKWVKKLSLILYQRKVLNKANVILTTCKQEMEHIRSLGINTPIAVIPNPVDIPSIDISVNTSSLKKRVGFIGRFAPIKNLEDLIQAWADSGKDLTEWELVLIGDGSQDYRNSLIKLANDLDIKNILFPGFLSGNEKEIMLNTISYLVLPSKSENFGMVVPEALIKKIPVIASKGTPWEELNLCNGGWWIETGSCPLTETLKKALSLGETERLKMGQNGSKLVIENYSTDAVSAKMVQLYNWLLNKAEKPEFVFF